MNGYLTPNSLPVDTVCRVLFIPNNQEFIANVTGALQELLFTSNWTPYGTLTPRQSADALVDMFDRFCFGERSCRLIGEIMLWPGILNPDDTRMLLCDGTHVSSADYPNLYDVIGLTYGGTGSTDFALPNLLGRVAIGESGSHLLGDVGGAETVTLTTAEMPSHTHTDLGHTHVEGSAIPNVTTIGPGAPEPTALPSPSVTGVGNANLTNTGSSAAHDNMQPFLTLSYFIVVR